MKTIFVLSILALLLGLGLGRAESQTYGQPVITSPWTGASLNDSGTITTGNTFQVLSKARPRQSFEFENTNASDKCYLFFGAGTATSPDSLSLAAGAYYARLSGAVPGDTIQVTCTSNGDTFWAQEQ